MTHPASADAFIAELDAQQGADAQGTFLMGRKERAVGAAVAGGMFAPGGAFDDECRSKSKSKTKTDAKGHGPSQKSSKAADPDPAAVAIAGRIQDKPLALIYDIDEWIGLQEICKRAFGPGFLHAIAMKSNPVASMMAMARNNGLGAECASIGEVRF